MEQDAVEELAAKFKIAACVIVKNEARDLPLWLEKSRIYADVLCVTDTGSTDTSAELALAAGARVSHFAWKGDFSAARNFALSQVPEDVNWIFLLDADEYFLYPERVRINLAKICLSYPQLEAGVAKIINVDEVTGKELSRGLSNERLLKQGCGAFFVGKVHEHLQKNTGQALQSVYLGEELAIHHVGYSPGRMKAKAKRNLTLLQAEQAALPEAEQVKLEGHLAKTWFTLGNWQETAAAAEKFLASGYNFTNGGGEIWHIYLYALRELRATPERQLREIERALEQLPRMPELYLEKGLLFCRQGKLAEAEELLAQAEKLAEEASDTLADSYMHQILPLYLYQLGINWYEQGKNVSKARRYLLAALQGNAYEAAPLSGYLRCTDALSVAEQLQDLRSIYKEKNGWRFILRQAANNGYFALAEYYAQKVGADGSAEAVDWQECCRYRSAGPTSVLQELAAKLRNTLEILVLAIFAAGEDLHDGRECSLWKKIVKILPKGMQAVLCDWAGVEEPEAAELAAKVSAYELLLPAALKQAATGRLRFVMLAKQLGESVVYRTVQKLIAAEYFSDALELLATVTAERAKNDAVYWQMAGTVLFRLSRFDEAEAALTKYRDIAGGGPEVSFYEAELRRLHNDTPMDTGKMTKEEMESYHLQELQRAVHDGLAKVIKTDTSEELPAEVTLNAQNVSEVYFALGKLAEIRSEKQEAANFYYQGLQADRYSSNNLLALCRLLSDAPAADLIALLQTVYDKSAYKWLAEVLQKLPPNKAQLYFIRYAADNSEKRLESAWCFLLAGRKDAAMTAAAEDYEQESCWLLAAAGATGNGLEITDMVTDVLPTYGRDILLGKDKVSVQYAKIERLRELFS